MREPSATLAAVFRLLPVSVSGDDLKGVSEQVRRGVPSNFAAVALNGLCFPTAGRIPGAGLTRVCPLSLGAYAVTPTSGLCYPD
jgi:hypothetical protein